MHRYNKAHSSSKRNTLGINTLAYTQLLKTLNQPQHGSIKDPTPHRSHTRLEYHQPYLDIELETSDRVRRTITVATRNISRGGLSVLHSSFAYPGTSVRTTLHRNDAKPCIITGKIVRCEHIGGVVHEIGIRFDNEIIVQEFIRPDILNCTRTHERITPNKLKAKVLFVGNDKEITPFAREYLQQTSIIFGFADTAKQAIDKGVNENDIICCCLDAGDMTGPEFTRTLRTTGFNKPVILIGTCNDDLTRSQIHLSSADAFIRAPIEEHDFLCAFAEYILTDWDPQILAAVRKHNAAQTGDALRNELAKLGIVLDQHTRTQDPVQIYATCNKIKSIAALLGLNTLRDKAIEVGEAVANTGQTLPHTKTLMDIKTMCIDRAIAA